MIYKTTIGNQTVEYDLDNSNTTFVLDAGTSVTSDQRGIFDSLNWHRNTIAINGKVTGGVNSAGIWSEGSETTVQIGKTGTVNGGYGIVVTGDYMHLDNKGTIGGSDAALAFAFADHARIENSGNINNMVSIGSSSDVSLTNTSGGIIKGGEIGVYIKNEFGLATKVTNLGEISGSNSAIFAHVGNETIINKGTMKGEIHLGDGKDTFDNRGGKVDHAIDGGLGNDTYILDKKVAITEAANGGFDTIKSTISMDIHTGVLADAEIETLSMIGNAAINGTGNNLSNTLNGNSAANVLKGLGGNDYISGGSGADIINGGTGFDNLDGGKGNDRLTGGADADTFTFLKNYDHDVVTDFQDGIDILYFDGFGSIDTLAEFKSHAHQQGADVVFDFGSGDTITIQHIKLANLTAVDFFIAI